MCKFSLLEFLLEEETLIAINSGGMCKFSLLEFLLEEYTITNSPEPSDCGTSDCGTVPCLEYLGIIVITLKTKG
jgi:hypothetical protein